MFACLVKHPNFDSHACGGLLNVLYSLMYNMINEYLRGRDCIESVRGSVNFELLP
jgi:hypothetical protein